MNNEIKVVNKYSIIQLVNGIIIGIVAPIMYVVLKQKGFEVFEVGLLIIISSLTTILFEVPCGILSDRIGRKKMFIGGQISFSLFCIGIIYASSFSLMALFMLISGIGTAMSSGTLDALFVDTLNKFDVTPHNMQSSIAKVGAASMLGLLGGAILSGFIVNLHLLNNIDSFENNYLFVALLIPILLIVVKVFIDEPQINSSTSVKSQTKNMLSNIKKNNVLVLMMISSSLGAVAFISFEKFWQLELLNLIDEQDVKWMFGALFSLSIIAGIIGQTLSGSVCKWFNNNYSHTLIFIRILQGILFLALYFDNNLFSFSLTFILIFFVSALSLSPVMTMFHHEIIDTERSSMLSIRSVFLQAGAVIGIIVASIVSQYISLKFAFMVSAMIYFISICLLFSKPIQKLGSKLSFKTPHMEKENNKNEYN